MNLSIFWNISDHFYAISVSEMTFKSRCKQCQTSQTDPKTYELGNLLTYDLHWMRERQFCKWTRKIIRGSVQRDSMWSWRYGISAWIVGCRGLVECTWPCCWWGYECAEVLAFSWEEKFLVRCRHDGVRSVESCVDLESGLEGKEDGGLKFGDETGCGHCVVEVSRGDVCRRIKPI